MDQFKSHFTKGENKFLYLSLIIFVVVSIIVVFLTALLYCIFTNLTVKQDTFLPRDRVWMPKAWQPADNLYGTVSERTDLEYGDVSPFNGLSSNPNIPGRLQHNERLQDAAREMYDPKARVSIEEERYQAIADGKMSNVTATTLGYDNTLKAKGQCRTGQCMQDKMNGVLYGNV